MAQRGLVSRLEVRGFRSIHEAAVALGPVAALVGDPGVGKSNLLAATRAVLDPDAAQVALADLTREDGARELEIRAELGSGASVTVSGRPPDLTHQTESAPPPVLYLPARLRATTLVDAQPEAPEGGARALEVFRRALGERLDPAAVASDLAPAVAAVEAVETCCAYGIRGVVFLIEEPELYLRPQAQRYLYRLLRRLAGGGNQVVYSTHSATFLNAARLDEVVFVERPSGLGTSALRPSPVSADTDFRVLSEFDAERSELLLARTAILVEGLTEKLALPFVFAALGADHDREGITIVECGGKANIPLYARTCQAAGIPFISVHDRDARPGRKPNATERALNAEIEELTGAERTVVLDPDFEGIARLRGTSHKPEQAWRRFAELDVEKMPDVLVHVARLALDLTRASAT